MVIAIVMYVQTPVKYSPKGKKVTSIAIFNG